jgi:hypothetical protein
VYGETYAQAVHATGLAEQTLTNYASVCNRIPRSRRRPPHVLKFSVHAEVAYLPPADQEKWLKEAVANKWKRRDLREALAPIRASENGKVIDSPSPVVTDTTATRSREVIDARPAARIKDPALLALLKFEYDECELTGETFGLHLHHVILKSQGGDDLRENIICVVQWKHDAYHAGDAGVRLEIATFIDQQRPDVGCYIAEKLGGAEQLLVWFERHGLR